MDNKTMKKTNHAARYKLVAILLLSFTTSFMFFVFSPLNLFFRSPPSFVLGLDILMQWYLLYTLVGFAVLLVMLVLLWKQKIVAGVLLLMLLALTATYARFALGFFSSAYIYLLLIIGFTLVAYILAIKLMKEKAIDVTLLLLFGCIVAAYLQVLFLNGNMVLIGESTASYSVLSYYNILNFLIWLLIAVSPLVLWLILRKRKVKHSIKVLVFAIAVILCMQVGELTVNAIQMPHHEGLRDNTMHLAFDPVLDLNNEENIVVFLIDAVSTDTMMALLEAYPELNYQLDGFTFYRNNIANFVHTLPAITTMLTQHYYEDHTIFHDFFEEAWAQESFLETLSASGFNINLHIPQFSTFGNIENLVSIADNLRIDGHINQNAINILISTIRLSAGRFAPYLIKEFFLFGFPADFGNTFFEFVTYGYTFQHPNWGNASDVAFYEVVKHNTISTNNKNSVFSFIYSTGAHSSTHLAFDAASESIYFRPEHDRMSALRASLHIANTYFDNLRQAGVYDNTTIIILSDHNPRGHRQRPSVLLIKPKGASGSLVFNDEAELSNKYLGASILQIAGLPHQHLGLSFFDIIDGAPPPPRFLYIHSSWWTAFQDGSNAIALRHIYEVRGDANNPDNWRLVDD